MDANQDTCSKCGKKAPTKVTGNRTYCVDCFPSSAGEESK